MGRLIITQMEFENFKSYAGVQTVGPFHQRFTSIVGPNGSGKSNVIDGLLFVFGKRAGKMRLNKVSELIHNSAGSSDAPFCKVSVYFQEIQDHDDGEGYDLIPGTEIIVSRSADRDSKSTYYMNDKRCQFKDVAEYFGTKGIDLDNNRFLILQGEVEQISLMKPKAPNEHEDGFLEFLEEIIGTSKYVEFINSLAKELEVLNDERTQKLNRVKISEKEKDNLEGSKNEAEEFLRKQLQQVSLQAELYQVMAHECSELVENIKKESAGFLEKQKHENEKKKELETQLSAIEGGAKKEKKELDGLNAEIASTSAALAKLDRQEVKFKEDTKHKKTVQKKAEAAAEKEAEKRNRTAHDIKTTEQDIAKQEAELAKHSKQIEIEQAKLEELEDSLKGETAPMHREADARQKELLPLKQALGESDTRMGVLNAEARMINERIAAVAQNLIDAKQNLATATEKHQQAKTTFAEVSAKLKTKIAEMKSNESRIVKADAIIKESQAIIKAKRTSLEEAKSSMSAGAVAGAWKALKENKSSFKGLIGRLGDQGAIDQKFDAAITNACSHLNSIVVQTVETADACVKYLKQHNLGRATFIVLDKIQNMAEKMQEPVQTPEGVHRLFDLIKVKSPDLKVAFYFALKNTVVADDIEQAQRVAYKQSQRWRTVTLDGKVIETSGTMTGGGDRIMKGGMAGSFVEHISEKEVKELEHNVEQAQAQLTAARADRLDAESSQSALKKEISQLETAMSRAEMDIKAMESEISDVQTRLASLPTQSSPADAARLKQLDAEIAKEEKASSSTRSKAETIENAIAELQKAIAEIGGTKMKTQRYKVESTQHSVDECERSITKLQVVLENHRKNLQKCEQAITSYHQEIEQAGAEIERINTEIAEAEAAAVEFFMRRKAAEERVAELQESMGTNSEEVDKLKKKLHKVNSALVDINNKIDEYSVNIRENTSKGEVWNGRLRDLIASRKAAAEETGPSTSDEATGGIKILSADELADVDKEKLKYEITMIESQLASMKPNMAAIAEFKTKEKEYTERLKEFEGVTEKRDAVRHKFDGLRKQRLDEFMAGFSIITMKLKEMYQMITLGGDAELELVDSLDPFSEGIVFSVRPPKKSWKNITNLSGGEKTLSSLALIFALHHYKPTPLYVMDEIDAALDFKNVSIVANYIKERTKDAQFVVISLRNNMFELADRLVGIYKTENQTKSVTINPEKFAIPMSA